LFREGKAPIVVASGRRLRPVAGIAELMEHDLVERGVPKDKIVRLAHDADNTQEEAEALTKLAAQRKWHSVIVVTSNYHTRRARYIFRRVFPQGIEVRVASAHDGDFDSQHWWEKRKSVKRLTREFAGMAVAIWELHGKSETSEKSQSVVGMRALTIRITGRFVGRPNSSRRGGPGLKRRQSTPFGISLHSQFDWFRSKKSGLVQTKPSHPKNRYSELLA